MPAPSLEPSRILVDVSGSASSREAALAAVALPDDGYSRPLYAVLAVTYVVVASVYGLRGARTPRPTP